MPSWLPARALERKCNGRGHGLTRPASLVHDPPCIVDPTKLKYLAVTVMTAASTVLAKSVRFLEHVSPGCCAGIASIVPVSWSKLTVRLAVSEISLYRVRRTD